VACISENVITETTKSTGMIHRKRRAMYPIIWIPLICLVTTVGVREKARALGA
jgi:hypothetical protein